jgi:hypothetical protein
MRPSDDQPGRRCGPPLARSAAAEAVHAGELLLLLLLLPLPLLLLLLLLLLLPLLLLLLLLLFAAAR